MVILKQKVDKQIFLIFLLFFSFHHIGMQAPLFVASSNLKIIDVLEELVDEVREAMQKWLSSNFCY